VDYERALEKVNTYLGLCDASLTVQEVHRMDYHKLPQWQEYNRQIAEGLPLIEKIAQEVDPRLVGRLRSSDPVIEHQNKRDACRELRGAILSR
jgi:hypothetical protein